MRRIPLFSLLVMAAVVLGAPVADAATVHWDHPVRIESAKQGGLNAVSCPTAKLCVAVDASGDLVTTTRPKGGAGAWKKAVHVDSRGQLTGVSCPTTSFCAAVDDGGDVLTSVDPTGGARHWTAPARIDTTTSAMGGYVGLNGISCPTSHLCVAVDNAESGRVFVSTDPAGGAGTWRESRVGGTLAAVSCPSTTLCLLSGSAHWESTDPAGGAASWHARGGSGNAVLEADDCPSVHLCVAVGFGNVTAGIATASTDPTGTEKAWTTARVEGSPPPYGGSTLDAVGCLSTSLCVALSSSDEAFISTRPAHGTWGAGRAIRPKAAAQTSAISCTSTLCVAVDSAGIETTGVQRG